MGYQHNEGRFYRERDDRGPRERYGRGDYDRGYDYDRERMGRERSGRDYRDHDPDDRGFFERAGDEVRSWFGDEEAERRRRQDDLYYEQQYGRDRDDYRDSGYRPGVSRAARYGYSGGDYGAGYGAGATSSWGLGAGRDQTQRQSLRRVTEHQEVVGSDGQHIGTVDHVRGDRILLTKSDKDSGGHHHSIPCSWITQVSDKVEISKTADEARRVWRDEENRSAFLGEEGRERDEGPHILNRSFSGTY